MNGAKKKKLLMRLLIESRDFMYEFLKEDLENNYDDPHLQDMLYWLAIMLRDIMVISKKLKERDDEEFQNGEGGVSSVLHILLEEIYWHLNEKSQSLDTYLRSSYYIVY